MSEEEVWGLAVVGGTRAVAILEKELGEPDLVVAPTERQWKHIPDEIRLREGQTVRIDSQLTDNGLGVGHGFAV